MTEDFKIITAQQVCYNLEIAKKFGVIQAIILNSLYAEANGSRDGMLSANAEEISRSTGVSKEEIKARLEEFVKLGILSKSAGKYVLNLDSVYAPIDASIDTYSHKSLTDNNKSNMCEFSCSHSEHPNSPENKNRVFVTIMSKSPSAENSEDDGFEVFGKIANSESDRLRDDSDLSVAKEIFEYWNSKKLRVHRQFGQNYLKNLKSFLKEYSVEILKMAIDHFEKVNRDKEFFWDYIWDLQDFIDMRSKRFLRFIEGGDIWDKYLEGSKERRSFTEAAFHNEEVNAALQSGESIEDIDKRTKEAAANSLKRGKAI